MMPREEKPNQSRRLWNTQSPDEPDFPVFVDNDAADENWSQLSPKFVYPAICAKAESGTGKTRPSGKGAPER